MDSGDGQGAVRTGGTPHLLAVAPLPRALSRLVLDSHLAFWSHMMQFNDCANNHFDNGSYDDAMLCYAHALGIMPNYSWAFCNRAAVQLAMGNIVRPRPHLPMSRDYHSHSFSAGA